MTISIKRHLLPGVLAAAAMFCSIPSQAAQTTFNFVRVGSLTNVDDSAGRWQFDGGNVFRNGAHVGYYIRKKRVSFGVPSSVNKAAVETTVIWKWGNYTFTTQGTHYFGTGAQVGGVSAASVGFTGLQDATYSGNHTTMTITY